LISHLDLLKYQIREGRQQSLHQCLEHEYRVSVNAVNAEVSTDFYEGCRAVLVDKDNTPKWDPPSLEEVTPEMVSQIFAPLGEGEELQLPVEEREGRARHHARL
jgi:3-hydroxyisobutyryl-CoA hydrolase